TRPRPAHNWVVGNIQHKKSLGETQGLFVFGGLVLFLSQFLYHLLYRLRQRRLVHPIGDLSLQR
ncbi:hypothetical protein, partial [Thermogutta sp.]|uniref:hypothetical protein n=1 Tax=Thermogutta sp. TaxID=1962930 RepID=UPI00321FD2F9